MASLRGGVQPRDGRVTAENSAQTSRSEALSRLAVAHGIAIEYDDIWGKRHRVPDATLEHLLAAMGIYETKADNSAPRETKNERDDRPIAPLIVLRTNVQPWRLRLCLPAQSAESVRMRVTMEDSLKCVDATVALVSCSPSTSDRAKVDVELECSVALPLGYHRAEFVTGADTIAETCLAVAPATCFVPASAQAKKVWGAAVQLYGVRSARNWGIGDFTDLDNIVAQWGDRGAGIVGVNPLHAMFPHEPRHASPYSPSSRLFRNTLYIDVEAVAEFGECDKARLLVQSPAFQRKLAELRSASLVDYVGVAAAKREVFELLYRHFRERHLDAGDARGRAFHAYVQSGGESLRRHALFEALQQHFSREDSAWGWSDWPEEYHDPRTPSVARFAEQYAERVEFSMYLQWQAEQQFDAAGTRARTVGLPIGIYTDLAVSIDRGGAEAWANQDLYALSVAVGAPPDAFNGQGQDWGLPPLIPCQLRDAGYAPFLATLRANMRHAGALRIDHVMSLARLFWIPQGSSPAAGTYVHYPFDDLLGLLALESHRHECVVIGEDLGTVPDYVRDAMASNAILSYRVLLFERQDDGEFKAPEAYPAEALVTATTHDLPTLAGWWEGLDIELRAAHGLLPSDEDGANQKRDRERDRTRLVSALKRAQLLPARTTIDVDSQPMDPPLANAVQAYLAATPSRLHVVQLEDVFGVRDQPNLPGTTDSHPNWRRKLPASVESWPNDSRFRTLATVLRQKRPRDRNRGNRGNRQRTASPPRARPLHVPRATYRVQLNRSFTFADATALVPYLATLGVSHVYCSPYLRARPGSAHGYDIVDHGTLNPEIGTRDDFERFIAALDVHGMGHLCDVVPNHVGVMGGDNAWWMDVLENGPASSCAEYFDIDWSPLDSDLAGRVLVPVLGDPYGAVLERGELKLAFEQQQGSFAATYFDHRFPIDARTYPALLEPAFESARADLAPEAAAAITDLVERLRALPARTTVDSDAVNTRRRDGVKFKQELAQLAARHAPLSDAITRVVTELNGKPGQPGTFEQLHALLETQAFRLAYWRVASDEINYRRFFDINELAALRMENETVFNATHSFILELAAAGKIHGLRIDHPDGLYDPARYFERLEEGYRQSVQASRPGSKDVAPVYVVLEKITASHEHVPEHWPVAGTTGYRFANIVNGLFVQGASKARIDRVWRAFVGSEALDYDTTVVRSKHATMQGPLSAELTMLTRRALRIARNDRHTRDFTSDVLRRAIEEIVAHFPVYRTYIAHGGASAQDQRYIDWAVKRARRASRAADPSVFDFVRMLMLASPPAGSSADAETSYREFAMRFQQFTAPVTAKSVEDTSFYRFNRLLSLNDVGGDPDEFGMTVRAFHGASLDRAATWPATMLATSTHDNKRSEDVRARINVISELPAAWRLTVRRWSRMNRSRKRHLDGEAAPSRNDEYLLYQTLIGTFPAGEVDDEALARYRTRIEQYIVKAVREAKVHTSWLAVNSDYEDACVAFVSAMLASTTDNLFLTDLREQCETFAWFGMLNSLSMALLKFASPGVPDLYQGNELLDLRLVDPDNRSAVDYELRRTLLAELHVLACTTAGEWSNAITSWFATPGDNRAKLWLTYRLLNFRAAHSELMTAGEYVPVNVTGDRAQHIVAFARRRHDSVALAVAGRLFASLGLAPGVLPVGEAPWGNTELDVGFLESGGSLDNVLTGETITVRGGRIRLAECFARLPVTLLHLASPG